MGAAIGAVALIVGALWISTRPKKHRAPRTVDWGNACGTAEQVQAWLRSRTGGAVNTATDLPTAAQMRPLGPGAVIVVEDECVVYRWDGRVFVEDPEATSDFHRSIS